jgi:hypothetical protein
MLSHCPNCQQPVLPDDTTCWQCGAKLAYKPAASTTPSSRANKRPATATDRLLALNRRWVRDDGEEVVFIRPGLVYGLLTLFSFLFLVGSLWGLSSAPLVQITAAELPPAGWESLTIGNYEYTLDLPTQWQVWRADRPEDGPFLTAGDTPEVHLTQQPLRGLANEWETILWGSEPTGELRAYVVVARTPAFVSDYEQLLQLAQQQQLAPPTRLFSSDLTENGRRTHLWAQISREPFRCRQQLVNGYPYALLLTSCVPQEQFGQYNLLLEQLHTSFELFQQ